LADAHELEKRDLQSLTWEQNIETLHQSLDLIPRVMQLRERYFPKALVGLGILWLLLTLGGYKDRFASLISGVETKTTETNRALETLARQIRSDAKLRELFVQSEPDEFQLALQHSESGRRLLQKFSAFLAQYGHRETSLTISQPAWKDEPNIVLGILKVLVRSELQETDHYQEWKLARDELLANSMLGRWPLRPLFLKSLMNARSLFQMREDTHFYATLAQPLVRRVALELGARLEGVGALKTATDIFHLRLDELELLDKPWPPSPETIDQIKMLVAKRRSKRESLANKPMVDPRLLVPQPQTLTDENIVLSGSPGSPGIVSGPVPDCP
jgi:pyruvate,water dikinase